MSSLFPAFLLALREGIEAALIVVVVLASLRKLGLGEGARWVWRGVAAAVGVSLAAGLSLALLGTSLEGRAEEIFEGVTMILACGVLTWMIFWMRAHGRELKRELEAKVEAGGINRWGLFSLAFVGVVREGIETVLFLGATSFKGEGYWVLAGGILGLLAAASLGWGIYTGGIKLKLSTFFTVTGVLLLFVSAGLLSQGVHELQEAGVFPVILEELWDLGWLLPDESVLGKFLGALFGYNADPSLLEVSFYVAYLVVVGSLAARGFPRRPPGGKFAWERR